MIIFIVVLVSIYFAKLANKYIKSIGTAFIGSFLLMHGLGQELGNFPPIFASQDINSLKDQVQNVYYVAYMAGFVFFTCFGGYIQLKYVADEDTHTDDDDFLNAKYSW